MNSLRIFLLSILTIFSFSPVFAGDQKIGTSLDLQGNAIKNTGEISTKDNAGVSFSEAVANGSNTITIKAPGTLGGSFTFTLPAGYGTTGQVLSTNGAGTLSWVDQTGGGSGSGDVVGPASSTDNGIATYDDATGKLLKSNTATLIDGDMSGLTQLNVDNLRLDGNALSVTNSNGSLALAPNGTGSITASTTGNARGDNALDLQIYRNGVSEVASGGYSVLMGSASTASGFGSVVAGSFNTASHSYATVLGNGGASDNNGDFIVGGKVSPVSSSKSQVHFEVDGPTSNASIGRQTDQSSVAGAENTLKLHTTNASNQSKFIGIKAPSTLTASTTYSMPSADGVDGSFLSTNGSGALAWKAANGGSGEVNAVTNPNATNNINGYADSDAGSDVSRDTTAANLALYPTIETGVKVNADAATEYISYCGTMPAGLKNRKLKLEWFQVPESGYATGDQKLEVYSTTSSTCASSLTRLALSTDASSVTAIPNATGKFTTTADTNSDGYFQIRWVRVSGTKFLTLQNIIYGPGIQPQGAVVTEWQSYTPTITNLPTSITTARYRRVGSSVEIMANATASGAATGEIRISLPTGLTINTSAIAAQDASTIFGHAEARNGGGSAYYDGNVIWASSTTAVRVLANAGSGYSWDATHPFTWANGDVLTINFSVPIAEWAGSGTLNVAQNDVEYVYNTSTTDADDTTSFGYGPQGTTGILGTTALTTSRAKRVRFQSPIQQTDSIWIEIYDSSSAAWLPVYSNRHGTLAYSVQNNTDYGMYLVGVNSTDVDVSFARYSRSTNSTFGTAGADWNNAGLVGSKWRVVKTKAGSAVGFGAATSTESGFVAPRTVQKNLTVTSSVAFTSYRAVGIAYQDFGGVWRLKFNIGGSVASGSRTGTTLTVSGVTFKSGFIQAVSSLIDSLVHQPRNAYTNKNASTIVVTHPTDTTTSYYVSGDVELESKPTWAN